MTNTAPVLALRDQVHRELTDALTDPCGALPPAMVSDLLYEAVNRQQTTEGRARIDRVLTAVIHNHALDGGLHRRYDAGWVDRVSLAAARAAFGQEWLPAAEGQP
ncbi:MAG TPA: hypothetical protein VI172_14705 [Candidatus Dormibacteraeota bacterium]|jgi:hypothetical protein